MENFLFFNIGNIVKYYFPKVIFCDCEKYSSLELLRSPSLLKRDFS